MPTPIEIDELRAALREARQVHDEAQAEFGHWRQIPRPASRAPSSAAANASGQLPAVS